MNFWILSYAFAFYLFTFELVEVYLLVMSKRFLLTLGILFATLAAAGIAVFLAKGYTFSPSTGKISGTGIISITSLPEGASVYLDGHLNTATNATINGLAPKEYDVKVIKEGFIPWEKKVKVEEGLVSDVKITLFPAIPTLYPLTFNGVVNPQMSPDGAKLAFGVPIATVSGSLKQKGGIWVWNLVSQPISFARSSAPIQLVASTSSLDFSKAKIRFSPDSQELLVTLQENGLEGPSFERNYILPADSTTTSLNDITPSLAATLRSWDEDQKSKDQARAATIKDLNYKNIATDSAKIKWSPDETKIIIAGSLPSLLSNEAKAAKEASHAKVVDLADVKSGSRTKAIEYQLPAAQAYYWLPDSKHIILVKDSEIAIAESDGSNAAVIYAGNFDGNVFPWPDASRIGIITSFPTPTANQPNLYGINLK